MGGRIALSRGCGSTGWVYINLACHHWMVAMFPEAAQNEVWGAARFTDDALREIVLRFRRCHQRRLEVVLEFLAKLFIVHDGDAGRHLQPDRESGGL